MNIGVVTTDVGLAQYLECELRNNGHQTVRSRDLLEALRSKPAVVFAEWMSGPNVPNLLVDMFESVERDQEVQ